METPSDNWQSHTSSAHFTLQWPEPRPCLSSAVLNGGLVSARSLINLRVERDANVPLHTPEHSLQQAQQRLQLPDTCVGMMTAASMASLRQSHSHIYGEALAVYVSCGLSNARRAGDPCDWKPTQAMPVGTINSVVIADLSFSTAGMVELHGLISEAKAAVLQDMNIRSPVSGQVATGTGTDACAIISGSGAPVRWLGKHTDIGEHIARQYMDALRSSIDAFYR